MEESDIVQSFVIDFPYPDRCEDSLDNALELLETLIRLIGDVDPLVVRIRGYEFPMYTLN